MNPKLYPKQRGAASAIIGQFSDPVQDKIHNLFSDGVVPPGKIVRSVFLAANQLLRMEQLAVRTSTNFINHLVSRTHRFSRSLPLKTWIRNVLSVKSQQHQTPRNTETDRKKILCSNASGDSWFQVNHHASWHVLACPCLREEPSTSTSRNETLCGKII